MRIGPTNFLLFAALLILCAACPPPEPEGLPIGQDQTILLKERIAHSFGDPNTRDVSFEATMPEAALWRRITLEYELECGRGGCDPWDRWANLEMQIGEGDSAQYIEITRVMTPYGVGGTWETDLTDLAPLLSGTRTFRSRIDTWVNPEGWRVTLRLHYEGGELDKRPIAVVPAFNTWVVYGDPDNPPATQLPPAAFDVPQDASSMRMRAFVTGHGQGNSQNCAEFCSVEHSFNANGVEESMEIWRDDCADNPINNQFGNWQPNRAGWCPGDIVQPILIDAGTVGPGDGSSISWSPAEYTNTCRGAPNCDNCAFGAQTCEFNGGNHTQPRWSISAAAIFYTEHQ